MAKFENIAPDLKKYNREVRRAVYDNIVDGTNAAMKDYNPRVSASSNAFYQRFKYRGKIGGAFHEVEQSGVYVKKHGSSHTIGANVQSAQAALLDSKGFQLRSRTQRKKGMITHGVKKAQQFNWSKAESEVQKARDRTQSVINGVKQK